MAGLVSGDVNVKVEIDNKQIIILGVTLFFAVMMAVVVGSLITKRI